MKGPHVERFKRQIDEARRGRLSKSLTEEAQEAAEARHLTSDPEERQSLDYLLDERAEQIRGKPIGQDAQGDYHFDPKREREAILYAGIAQGTAIPLGLHYEAYLKQQRVKARTAADDRRAIRFLNLWCDKNNTAPVLQAITKRIANSFLDDLPELAGGVAAVTIKKYRQRLSRYWQWLVDREYAEANIWRDVRVQTPAVLDHEKERPFTREEMVSLLEGPATQAMHDLMRVAALSGARLEAIVDLKVQDCAGGVFRFKPQKKETAYRSVPIHSALRQIISRRTKGKPPSADVFPEWPGPKKAGSVRERSFKTSNAFTDYRRLVGVDHTIPGRRRALTNFHSFRRWFITEAERAGQPENIIAAVVGHKREGMTLGVYSSGPSGKQFKACVEAVRLPTGAEPAPGDSRAQSRTKRG